MGKETISLGNLLMGGTKIFQLDGQGKESIWRKTIIVFLITTSFYSFLSFSVSLILYLSFSLSLIRSLALSHTLLISPFLTFSFSYKLNQPFLYFLFFIYLFLSFSVHFLFFSHISFFLGSTNIYEYRLFASWFHTHAYARDRVHIYILTCRYTNTYTHFSLNEVFNTFFFSFIRMNLLQSWKIKKKQKKTSKIINKLCTFMYIHSHSRVCLDRHLLDRKCSESITMSIKNFLIKECSSEETIRLYISCLNLLVLEFLPSTPTILCNRGNFSVIFIR